MPGVVAVEARCEDGMKAAVDACECEHMPRVCEVVVNVEKELHGQFVDAGGVAVVQWLVDKTHLLRVVRKVS